MDSLTSNIPFLVFFAIGTIAVASSILVVAMRNPVHSALFLLLSFVLVAAIFILQQAEFVGAVQMLVYAGGIMVLFLFVVMLVNPGVVPAGKSFQHQWDIATVLLPIFLLPFLYILGVQNGTEEIREICDGFQYKSVSMRSFQIG